MARQSRHEADRGVEVQVEKLKKEYRYTPDKAGVDELTNSGHTSRTLFTLAGRSYTGTDFARFAAAYPAGVRKQLDAFIVKPYLIMKIHVWSRNIRIYVVWCKTTRNRRC